MAKMFAASSLALMCLFWATSSAVALGAEEDTCLAGDASCSKEVAGGPKLLQRRTDVKRSAMVTERVFKPRAPRPPRNRLFRISVRNVTGENSTGMWTGRVRFGRAHSFSENLLHREGLAGEALGEGDAAEELVTETENGGTVDANNALDVINKNAEHMTPEEALRNGLLTTVETIVNLTGTNGEDADCAAGTNGTLCFQGDMVPVSNEQLVVFQTLMQLGVKKLNGKYAGNLWNKGKVSYCYATDVSESMKTLMETAFQSIRRAVPCLKFINVGNPKKYKGTDSNEKKACKRTPSIFIQSLDAGCWSYVGMLTTSQLAASGIGAGLLNMQDPGCYSLGTAIHEILHALAQAHEQSRPDRDMYMNIYWDNIKEGKEHNFDIDPDGHTGLDYDFLSIMQYSTHSFSSNGQPTLGAKDGLHDGQIGQRVGMSNSDAEQLALMYKDVNKRCKAKTVGSGMGCADTGTTDCDSLETCGLGTSMKDCCACGAGIEYQCWKGSKCRKVDQLPMDPSLDHADCIVDRTESFPGYGCVIQNECGINIRIQCEHRPGYFYDHPSANGYYVAPWEEICTAKSTCTFADP